MILLSAFTLNFDSSALSNAAKNTLIGMTSVFIILIFISLVISSLSLVSKFNNKKNDTLENEESSEIFSVQSDEDLYEENLTDDLELTAVITAALMHYLGSEQQADDGLVIRNIRRVR